MFNIAANYFYASIWGSVLILVILLFRTILSQAPRRIICILWLLAALRLLLPFRLESSMSLQPHYENLDAQIAFAYPQEDAAQPHGTQTDPWEGEAETLPEKLQTSTNTSAAPAEPKISVLPMIWICGAVIMALYAAVSYFVLQLRLSDAVIQEKGILESDRIRSVFVLGYLKPRIFLPFFLSETDRKLIIAHEKAHIAYADNWWKLLGYLCLCLHWYNPFVWGGYILFCRDIEYACDERVIKDMGAQERKQYAYALLNSKKKPSGLLYCPVAFGEVNIKQRIKNVLAYRHAGMVITIASLLAVAFAAICFMTVPTADPPPVHPDETAAATQTSLPITQTSEPPSLQTTIPPIATLPPATVPVAPPTNTPSAPISPATEPKPTSAPDSPTSPTADTQPPAATGPTESPTSPPPDVSEEPTPSTTAPNYTDQTDVIAGGEWMHTPVYWQITADGTLTLSGNRSVQGSNSYIWHDYADIVTSIVISDGITSLPQGIFQGMHRVTRVYIGRSLKKLPTSVFAQCTSLTSVEIPSNITEIGKYAFSGCSQLSQVIFASGCQVTTIGERAFQASGIKEFKAPDSLITIDFYAFAECKSLRSVDLQGNLQEINGYAFDNCTGLKDIVVGPSVVSTHNIFRGCTGIESVEIYSSAYFTFANVSTLKTAVIGGNVTKIGSWFENCTALQSVELRSAITNIGDSAFFNCSSLTRIRLPESLTTIGANAFRSSGLTSIQIPPSVQEISICAFGFSNLREIIFLGDAPILATGTAFSELTLTAHYPADNPTWTEDVLLDYGGNVTWIAK